MFKLEKKSFGEVTVHLLYYEDFEPESYFEDLLPAEINQVETFKSVARKKEFVATRYLRTLLFGKTPVLYSEVGAPYLSNGEYISISHAKNVIGIASTASFPIGFDLEPFHEKVHRVKHKFLHASEIANFDTDNTHELIKMWSAKESLYKVSGKNGLLFSTNLILEKIEATLWRGILRNNVEEKTVHLQVITHNDFALTVTIDAVK